MISTIITAVAVTVGVLAVVAYGVLVYFVFAVLIGLVMPPPPDRRL